MLLCRVTRSYLESNNHTMFIKLMGNPDNFDDMTEEMIDYLKTVDYEDIYVNGSHQLSSMGFDGFFPGVPSSEGNV